jgi:hypothetical protein
MSYQLVPPHCHRTNAAERAIRTFKEHFKAGLATVNPEFRAHLWDRLLPQTEITLNLLRSSRLHPQLSAATHYHGLIYYNKIAFGPPGCKIIAHEKTSQRRTWAAHGQPGWPLGPDMNHYRCQNMYIMVTASEKIVNTLDFFPHNSPMPQMSSTDRILVAAQDMTDALKNPHTDVLFATIGEDTIAALEKLSEIFTMKFKNQEKPDPTPEQEKLHGIQRDIAPEARILFPPIQNHITKKNPTATHFLEDRQPPPRVVTPATRRVSPPRVKARTHQLSPHNLSHDFLDLGAANCACALGDNHWTKTPMMNSVIHPVTVKEMQYKYLMKDRIFGPLFDIGLSNELGRICQGIRDVAGTNTAFFIALHNIPNDRKITYGKLVCDFKPNKTEKHRVRLTVGGDRLDYSGDTSTSTADITTFKILIKSTLSTNEATMMMMDIKNHYLGTPLPTYEYMILPLTILPLDIIEKYDLKRLAIKGWVYLEFRKGVHSLKQASHLANQLLQKRLKPFGYYPARHTPGIWLHNTKTTALSLVVDDFAIKYVTKSNANHLRDALLQHYEITTDWEGTVYSGITLDWHYKNAPAISLCLATLQMC